MATSSITANFSCSGTRAANTLVDLLLSETPPAEWTAPAPVVVISYVDYRPVAPKRRKIVKNPKLAFKISDEDLFSDDSHMWEACDDKVALA